MQRCCMYPRIGKTWLYAQQALSKVVFLEGRRLRAWCGCLVGSCAGGIDAYYYAPGGKRCKSMVKVAEALGLGAMVAALPTHGHKGVAHTSHLAHAPLPASPRVLPKAAPVVVGALGGAGASALQVGAGRPPPRRQASPVAFGELGPLGYHSAAPQVGLPL